MNGNPLLKAPSTVNNMPIQGARVRFRTVVAAIAILSVAPSLVDLLERVLVVER